MHEEAKYSEDRNAELVAGFNAESQRAFARWIPVRFDPGALEVVLEEDNQRVGPLIAGLLETYCAVSGELRKALSSKLNVYARKQLLGTAARSAALAVRKNSTDLVRSGLLMLALEGGAEDPRESMIVMSMLHNSALKLGMEPSVVFAEGADFASAKIREEMLRFPERAPATRDLAAFGLAEKYDPQKGFTYESRW